MFDGCWERESFFLKDKRPETIPMLFFKKKKRKVKTFELRRTSYNGEKEEKDETAIFASVSSVYTPFNFHIHMHLQYISGQCLRKFYECVSHNVPLTFRVNVCLDIVLSKAEC